MRLPRWDWIAITVLAVVIVLGLAQRFDGGDGCADLPAAECEALMEDRSERDVY